MQALSLAGLIDNAVAKGQLHFLKIVVSASRRLIPRSHDAAEGYVGIALAASATAIGGILLAALLKGNRR